MSYKPIIKQLRRQNEIYAHEAGVDNEWKRSSGAPKSYRLIHEDEVEAVRAANIPYYPMVYPHTMSSNVNLGWVDPHVYNLIVLYEDTDEYSGLSLTEWLVKTYSS